MPGLEISSPFDIDPGATEKIVGRASEAGEAYVLFVNTAGGVLQAGKTQAAARVPIRRLPPGQAKTAVIGEDGEEIWVHNPSSTDTRTLHADQQGFTFVSGGIDADFAQNVNTAQQSAISVKEVNADQTATIGTSGSQTTTVRADADELWRVAGLFISWDANADWDGGSDDTVTFTVETEKEAVEWGFAEFSSVAGPGHRPGYASGDWRALDGNATIARSRNNVDDQQISDTNGVNVVVDNQSTTDDMENERKIRFAFEVVSV